MSKKSNLAIEITSDTHASSSSGLSLDRHPSRSAGTVDKHESKTFPLQVLHLPQEEDDSSTRLRSDASSHGSSTNTPHHSRSDQLSVSSIDQLPRWYQNTASTSKERCVKLLRTLRIQQLWQWVQGPLPPRKLTFTPLLPRLQAFPMRILSTRWKEYLFIGFCCIFWLVTFSTILATSAAGTLDSPNALQPFKLSCVAELWSDAPSCGINGANCQPFEGGSFPFMCPSNCLSAQVLEPHTIGDQEINYRSMVIGGPNVSDSDLAVYRGDSFICAAAIHAGIISNEHGGCGILTRRGERRDFASTERNGLLSIGFPSSFPLSISFESVDLDCKDPQWTTLAMSVLATTLVSLITSSAAVFTSITFVILFFQVGLESDSPYYIDFASLVSAIFARFLPAAFLAVVIYQQCIKRTLTNLGAKWERTILWLGGCWVGSLNNYTFDKIPISRLTPHDLQQQPGAITALVIIVVIIILIAIGQIWAFRLEGRLPRYLGFYAILGVIIGCLVSIPGLDFRLHHYILALILLPGTSLQTRPSLLYQGLLMGLFINGTARWGFASILQTPAALLGDGQLGSALPQDVLHSIISDTIQLTITHLATGYDGVSILVNDVERFQGSQLDLPVAFNWTRTNPNETLFFRFAFTATYKLGGVSYGDYTKPGIWYGNGTWHEMLPGPSR